VSGSWWSRSQGAGVWQPHGLPTGHDAGVFSPFDALMASLGGESGEFFVVPMTASRPCSEPGLPPVPRGRLIVLEGMPGAGKTTTATALAARGHSVVGEYTSDTEATLAIGDHPDISDDEVRTVSIQGWGY